MKATKAKMGGAIEVSIPIAELKNRIAREVERLLGATIGTAVANVFRAPNWSAQKGGRGYESIAAVVAQMADEIDLDSIVRERMKATVDQTIEKVISEQLARRVRRAIHAQAKDIGLDTELSAAVNPRRKEPT